MVMEELDILEKTGDETIEIWIVHLKVQAKTFEPFSFSFNQLQYNLFGNKHFATKIISFRFTFISFVKS
jgi:hypothetical protein